MAERLFFGNKITIEVSNTITSAYYDSLLDFYGVFQFGYDDTKPNIRYLQIDSTAGLPVLDIANRLYENDEIVFSHPRFRCDFEKFYFPADSLFIHQWNYCNPNIYDNDQGDYFQGKDIEATKAKVVEILRNGRKGRSNLSEI